MTNRSYYHKYFYYYYRQIILAPSEWIWKQTIPFQIQDVAFKMEIHPIHLDLHHLEYLQIINE